MNMLTNFQKSILSPKAPIVLYVVAAIAASIQALLISHMVNGILVYTDYNNYVIFKNSFFHLLKGTNMYVLFPDEQNDLYKYSPTFALIMGLFAWLPNAIGLPLWNLCNALVLLAGVRMLPFAKENKSLLLFFIFLELLTSIQNSQSNGMLAGLMLLAYGYIRKGKIGWSVFCLVVASFIKLYGIIGFAMFLFYPDKWRQMLYTAGWVIVFALIPLVATSPTTLLAQYQNWFALVKADTSASYGLSVMGVAHTWFGMEKGKEWITYIAGIIFLLPLLRIKLYKNELYRLLFVAFMLIWVIIFNYKAESPTYVIAVAGVGCWYFALKKSTFNSILLVLVFVLTCLTPTDLFPRQLKHDYLYPYCVKTIPCFIVWVVIAIQLLFFKKLSLDTAENRILPQ
jgi:Glycosyltransferase family 87